MKWTAEASTYIKAPRPLVYSVLQAYGLYRAWVPDVTESRVLAREGDVALAELISPRYGNEKFVLELVESPEDGLTFRQIDRYERDGLAGSWELEEADAGEGVVVRGVLSLTAGIGKLLGRRHLRRALERTLEALGERSLRLARLGAEALERRLLLEVVRRGDAVRVRLGDHEFELAPRGTAGER